MKKIFFVWISLIPILTFCQVATPFPPYSVTNQVLNMGATNIYKNAIVASSDCYNGSTTTNFTATQSIILSPVFGAQPGVSGSYFLGKIGTGPITDAEVMGTSNQAYQFQKFEIGVNIENDANGYYKTQINNFMSDPRDPDLSATYPYPPFTYSPSISTDYLNPYDPDEIKIEAVFTNISSGHQFTRYGFYQEDVTVLNPMTATTSYSISIDNKFPFRIRFAPPETGDYTVTISLYINGSLAPGNQPYTVGFNTAGTSNPGDIIVSPTIPWRLGYSNSSNLFIPIGQDIPFADPDDPYLTAAQYGKDGNGNANDNAFVEQRKYMTNLASHGGNYVGFHQPNASIETFSHGQSSNTSVEPLVCDYSQASSYEVDNDLQTCEQNGLYIHLDIDAYDDLNDYGPYGSNFGWWQATNYTNNTQLYNNPYYYLLGGSLSDNTLQVDPVEFFSNSVAQEYFEKRLFYIEARWGYSPNIAVWELIGEVDNYGVTQPTLTSSDYKSNASSVGAWADIMVDYLHSLYPSHLVTMTYAGGPAPGDASPTNFDVLTIHDYNDGGSFYDGDENGERAGRPHAEYGSLSYSKPVIFGELGNGDCSTENHEDYSFHQAVWATAFIGAGSGLYWWDWEEAFWDPFPNLKANPIRHRKNLDALSDFLSSENSFLASANWSPIPQCSLNTDYLGFSYYYNIDFTTGNQIGWLNNSSVNWENYPTSVVSCSPHTTPAYMSTYLIFNNLNWGSWYFVNLYNTYTGGLVQSYNLQAVSGTIQIAWVAETTPDTAVVDNSQPDYAFTVQFDASHSSVHHQNNDSVTILPNDTIYLPMDSVHYAGSLAHQYKNYNFSWNFGNGQTSNSPNFPKFIYYKTGNYLTTVKLSDSAGNDKTSITQTYVVLDSASKPHHTVTAVQVSDSVISSSLKLVPNPTSSTFTIFTYNNQPLAKVEIYDVVGRLCLSSVSPKNNVFDISTYSAGMYLVKIYYGAKEYNRKVVKVW